MRPKPIALTAFAALVLAAGVYAILYASGNTAGSRETDATPSSCEEAVNLGEALAANAAGDVAAFRPLDEPLDLAGISFVDANGKPKTLGDWRGKTVLFNLWATWCPPCREEMPYLEELQVMRGGEAFEVVPVSIDLGNAAKPKKFYEDAGLSRLPFLHDNTMEAFQQLKEKAVALGMPATLLVDANSCGLGVLNGPAHWASPDAIALVDSAIALQDRE